MLSNWTSQGCEMVFELADVNKHSLVYTFFITEILTLYKGSKTVFPANAL